VKRKLASIQIVSALDPIPNADRIERATILGWNVVVKKEEFTVGSKCIFFEVDAQLPDGHEWAEFMRPRNFRVKTCKLRGVLSQGLALPVSILPEGSSCEVGDDVSEILNVKKYEPKTGFGFKSGDAMGNFPSFIPKTDELRLQSILPVLNEIRGVPIFWTIKCDGTSSTFCNLGGEFYACSRNLRKKPGENVYWEMVNKYGLQECLPDGFAIQGEICGPGIQKNRLALKETDLFVFDVFDILSGKYLGLHDFVKFCGSRGLRTVPVESIITNPDSFDLSLDTWLERARGLYTDTNNNREGIVVRTIDPVYSHAVGSRLSFKVLNNDFLLKDED